jgi:PAS domain S-box-containing protein
LRAIQSGEVDALVVSTNKGDRVFTLEGADQSYRILIEGMKEGAAMLSDDSTVLYCNNSFASVVKQPIEKIVGNNIRDIVFPTNMRWFEELLAEGRKGKGAKEKEITLQATDGSLIPTLMSVTSLEKDDLKITCLIVTDLTQHMEKELKRYTNSLEKEVTERKRAEEELRESEERWATTVSSIGDAVITTDLAGNVTFLNGVAEKLTGWSLAEASNKPLMKVFNIINEKSRKILDSPVNRILKEGTVVGLANHTILIRQDGKEVPIDDSGAPVRDKDGNFTGIVLVFRDITERKKAEEKTKQLFDAVQQEKDRLSSLVSSIPDEVWFADANKKFILANPAATREFNLDSSANIDVESMATRLEVYRPNGSKRPADESPPLRALKGEIVRNQEEIIKTPATGELRYRQVNSVPVKDSTGKIVGSVSVVRDITELKNAEKALEQAQVKLQEYSTSLERLVEERTMQLRDAERLAAIGTTAGMVGHDIRNPLQAIVGDLYLAKSDLAAMPEGEEKEGLRESLEEIEKNVGYIDKIVQDLQDFAKPLKPVAKETDLEELCQEVFFNNGIPENVDATYDVNVEVKKVVADPDILKRILSNLVNNAVQAMPKGGKLEVEAFLDAGQSVITVKDTGVGIPEEIKPKIFTPLFTTKSKGQGFGLAVVKRMTEVLGGTVTFESEVGEGTKFIVCLPPQELNGKWVFTKNKN